jgi:hypothetical protein
MKRGDDASARRQLDAVLARARDAGTLEAAQWQRCRIDVDARPAQADECLRGFRLRHPDSAHDEEALALRAGLARGCAAQRQLLDEYLGRYPDGGFAAEAASRRTSCR